jgi:serine/threonine-protein phosphatase 2A regulatory subunit A
LIKFSNDENPSVKKELAIVIKDLIGLLDADVYSNFIGAFLKDTNDIVRIPIMDALVGFKSNHGKYYELIYNVLMKLGTDESWRVRLTVSDKAHEILAYPNIPDLLKNTIIDIYSKFFEDQEAEVRNISCQRLESVAQKLAKDDNFDKVLTQLKKIEKDSVSYVRAALATNLLKICPLIGKVKTNDHVFPLFLNLIRDDNHEIRMTLLKNLDSLHKVISIEVFIQSILVSIIEIANNKIWRTRIQICEIIPILASIMVRETFMEQLFPLCIGCLTDDVFSIREAGCTLMSKLYKIYKSPEFEKVLLEKLGEMRASSSYLIRNTILFLTKEFILTDIDLFEKKLLAMVLKLTKDRVSNVRMNCANVFKALSDANLSKDSIRDISIAIEDLRKDKDMDVINILDN